MTKSIKPTQKTYLSLRSLKGNLDGSMNVCRYPKRSERRRWSSGSGRRWSSGSRRGWSGGGNTGSRMPRGRIISHDWLRWRTRRRRRKLRTKTDDLVLQSPHFSVAHLRKIANISTKGRESHRQREECIGTHHGKGIWTHELGEMLG
jgi:hypothetical protein